MRIGLDIGGTKMLGVAINGDPATPLAEIREPTVPDPEILSNTIEAVVAALEVETGTAASAVGVGIAGLVDRAGTLRFAPNIRGVTEYPVGSELRERLGRPVVVDNDATTAAWAEATIGAGAGSDHVVYVALGTGIGTAFVLDGRPYRGWSGFAGEGGHMIVDRRGPRHHTGARGPWELYASGTALRERAMKAATDGGVSSILDRAGSIEAIGAEHIQQAVEASDPDALELLDDFGRDVGLGVAALVHLLDPQVVVIGGGLVDLGEALLRPIRRWTVANVLGGAHRPAARIEAARLGSRAAAIGAAMLAGEPDR